MSLLRAAPASLLLLLLLLLGACGSAEAWVPRSVVIEGGKFVNRKTGAVEIMNGTNVIMKGPPCESSFHRAPSSASSPAAHRPS
jgi:hypothetical protein